MKDITIKPDTDVVVPVKPKANVPLEYTRVSMREVVWAVARLLSQFATHDHPGLREPQNVKKVIPDTGVVVHPNAGGRQHLIGFQFFVTDDANPAHLVNNVAGIIFDLHAYEKHGDRYVYNMLKKVTQMLREKSRPSDAKLKALSTQFSLLH